MEQTLQPSDKVGDYSYEVTRHIDLTTDGQGQEVLPLEAWINLHEGGQNRHYLEGTRLASCGWNGSASSVVSAELNGDVALVSTQLADVDPAQFEELEALGVVDSLPSFSGIESLKSRTETVILTGEDVFPAATTSANAWHCWH